jgi:hypothetical protein
MKVPSEPSVMSNSLVKSFRLYRSRNFESDKVASDHSESERQRFKEDFKRVAQKYREKQKKATVWVMGALICFLGVLGVKTFSPSLSDGLVALWFVAALAMCLVGAAVIMSGRVECPACHKDIEEGVGRFCPECGAILPGPSIWHRPNCANCGKKLVKLGRNRNYQIRNCSYCGLSLDDEGL